MNALIWAPKPPLRRRSPPTGKKPRSRFIDQHGPDLVDVDPELARAVGRELSLQRIAVLNFLGRDGEIDNVADELDMAIGAQTREIVDPQREAQLDGDSDRQLDPDSVTTTVQAAAFGGLDDAPRQRHQQSKLIQVRELAQKALVLLRQPHSRRFERATASAQSLDGREVEAT